MVNPLPFRRTVWSTTIDGGDERNDCVIWSGPSAGVARILLTLQLVDAEVGTVRVTPQALVSDDGEAWVAAGWLGSSPSLVVGNVSRLHGPFRIDPFHGRRSIRVALTTDALTTGLVVGSVVGAIHLLGP